MTRTLRRSLRLALVGASLLALGGCASGPEVRADYDRTADSAALSDKLRVSNSPIMVTGAGYYGYRASMYATWPAYADQTTVTQYKEGTLNIDVVDAARKQLVWEGVVTGSVTQKALDDVRAAVDVAVAAAFAKYPIPAPPKAK